MIKRTYVVYEKGNVSAAVLSTLMCLMNNPIRSFFLKNSAPPILPIRDYMFIKYENFEK